MTNLLLTLVVGMTLGYLVFKLKVPGGMMVGAIIGVAALNIAFGVAYMPSYAKTVAQITAGAFIGCTVDKNDLLRLRSIFKPALVLLAAMLFQNILLGFIIHAISPLDLLTSLMSSVPGGMTDIPIISADMGADVPKVAVLQFIRMVFGIGLFPTIIAAVARREAVRDPIIEQDKPFVPVRRSSGKGSTGLFVQTLAVAAVFGMIGYFLDIPAGVLLFSMIGVIGMKMLWNKAFMPLWAKRVTQALSGAYIGCSVGYKDVLEMKHLIFPAMVIVTGYLFNCLVVGWILHRRFGMGSIASMLAATPAGASDMTLISSDLGVQSMDLIILQIIRLVVVIAVFPQVINLIVKLAG